jgi:hypothetical protein
MGRGYAAPTSTRIAPMRIDRCEHHIPWPYRPDALRRAGEQYVAGMQRVERRPQAISSGTVKPADPHD